MKRRRHPGGENWFRPDMQLWPQRQNQQQSADQDTSNRDLVNMVTAEFGHQVIHSHDPGHPDNDGPQRGGNAAKKIIPSSKKTQAG